jgi:hypothetical protein
MTWKPLCYPIGSGMVVITRSHNIRKATGLSVQYRTD